MLQEMCLASMIAINCLGDYSPNYTAECKINPKEAKAYVEKAEKISHRTLLGGVAGVNPNNNEVFRTWWLPTVYGLEGFILHYVPAEQICETMTVEEYEELKEKEKRYNNKRRNNSNSSGKQFL